MEFVMTSKERMVCALEGGRPDRLPVSAHQWQPYHLEKYLGGISDIEAFEMFGMDAQIQYFADMGQFWVSKADFTKSSTAQWQDQAEVIKDDPDDRIVHHTIVTPDGSLAYKTGGNRMTTWITEYMIKADDDIEIIRKYCMPNRNFAKVLLKFIPAKPIRAGIRIIIKEKSQKTI